MVWRNSAARFLRRMLWRIINGRQEKRLFQRTESSELYQFEPRHTGDYRRYSQDVFCVGFYWIGAGDCFGVAARKKPFSGKTRGGENLPYIDGNAAGGCGSCGVLAAYATGAAGRVGAFVHGAGDGYCSGGYYHADNNGNCLYVRCPLRSGDTGVCADYGGESFSDAGTCCPGDERRNLFCCYQRVRQGDQRGGRGDDCRREYSAQDTHDDDRDFHASQYRGFWAGDYAGAAFAGDCFCASDAFGFAARERKP